MRRPDMLSFVQRLRPGRTLRARVACALIGLSLASCAFFGLCACVTYELTITHVLTWHMEPIMRMLARAYEDGGSPREIQELASSLRVSWYTDQDIPSDMRPSPEEGERLTRARGGLYIYVSRSPYGDCYAVTGKIKDMADVEAAMLKVGCACALVSLLAAVLLTMRLSRHLVGPLTTLTESIRAGRPMADSPLLARGDEAGEMARAFACRERELKAFLVREQLFTGDVSHELRTPLTVLQGAVEILEIRLDSDPTLLPVVQRMQRTIDAMTVNVRTMLLLARTPEQLEQKDFDMSALVRQNEDRVAELLRDRHVSYETRLPDSLMLRGNLDLAALVLNNLLDNACRYTEKGHILVELTTVCLTMTDTAPVISEELREKMFERGIRGSSGTPGSGLGLSLVQRGCERLGWHVTYATWDRGNRFTVFFTAA